LWEVKIAVLSEYEKRKCVSLLGTHDFKRFFMLMDEHEIVNVTTEQVVPE
jgi:hypothetical protein